MSSNSSSNLFIKAGREKSVRHRHPWVFSSAIATPATSILPGEIVRVCDSNGKFLAHGYYNSKSQIAVRILSWDETEIINDDWLYQKIRDSIQRRKALLENGTTSAVRLIYAEADRIPGLIADYYGGYVVIQSLTAGMEKFKMKAAGIIMDILNPEGIYERSDADVRKLEGLPVSCGVVIGKTPPEKLMITENGLKFGMNIKEGQKTGFFIDQRDNRRITSQFAAGKDVLDCFCYTGGFSLSAKKAGAASVYSIDSSGPALKALSENYRENNLEYQEEALIEGDVFEILRNYRDTGRKFDMVILDPPKLAPTKTHLEKAMRAYKDLNLLAMKILNKEGILATFSCSGGVASADFRMMVAWASADAGRDVQTIRILSQAEDHPILSAYPESEYLKGLICRVI